MAQLSIRKSHPFGTAFPFERLSYGRIGLPFVNTFQSKRGSIRNGFGITPRGPVGPSPPKGAEGALRYPWAPWGSLGYPWVHPKGSAPCWSDGKASREFGGGAALPERGYWVGGMRVSVFGLYIELEKRPAGAFSAEGHFFKSASNLVLIADSHST